VQAPIVNRRVVFISLISIVIAAGAGLVAQALTRLIGLITNISFYGRLSTAFNSPAYNHLGPWVIAVPVIGGVIVGLMARYGSEAIRGHGIPEAMEQVLFGQSRIPPRVTFLKPLSAAVAIGTGGPFGAEGPIIATGGGPRVAGGSVADRHRRRAQDALGRRGRRRHGGHVRLSGRRSAARHRTVAVRRCARPGR
jgi:CIC family chloride channel protein